MKNTLFALALAVWTTATHAWTYQDIRNILETDSSIRRIDDLIRRLDSELLGNYLLIHRSSSLQQSSPDAPRVILFTNDGTFIMAFNGKADFAGYDRLEMIQFNDQEKKFEFYEVRFPESNTGNVVFSAKNPEECQGCHRNDLRPNWDAYPFWKDAYGTISNSEHERVDQFSEATLFQNFIDGVTHNPRYNQLLGLTSRTVEGMSKRNLDFNRTIGWRNFQRIANYLKTTPEYTKYRYAFLGALQSCDISSFIPTTMQSRFAQNISYYLNDAAATDLKIQRFRSSFVKRTETFYYPKIIGSLRYLLEGRHIPAGSWSMVLGTEDFHLSTGSTGVRELGIILLKLEPDLKGLGCNDLKSRSLKALASSSLTAIQK